MNLEFKLFGVQRTFLFGNVRIHIMVMLKKGIIVAVPGYYHEF